MESFQNIINTLNNNNISISYYRNEFCFYTKLQGGSTKKYFKILNSIFPNNNLTMSDDYEFDGCVWKYQFTNIKAKKHYLGNSKNAEIFFKTYKKHLNNIQLSVLNIEDIFKSDWYWTSFIKDDFLQQNSLTYFSEKYNCYIAQPQCCLIIQSIMFSIKNINSELNFYYTLANRLNRSYRKGNITNVLKSIDYFLISVSKPSVMIINDFYLINDYSSKKRDMIIDCILFLMDKYGIKMILAGDKENVSGQLFKARSDETKDFI